MNDTTFDPERFKLPPEVVAELAKAKPKRHGKRPKPTEPFLQIPHKAIVVGGSVNRNAQAPSRPPIDLASMRAQGVHNLIAYCQKHIPAVSELNRMLADLAQASRNYLYDVFVIQFS
jgi:hypothetical protein